MGYMGFGMQKWIYSRKPRKAFHKGRIPSFTAVDNYSREFSLKHRPKSKAWQLGLIGVLIVAIIAFFIIVNKPSFIAHANEVNTLTKQRIDIEDARAFEFLYNSGWQRMKAGQYKSAYSEFKLAYAIRQDDAGLNQLILETLSLLCEEDTTYCAELDIYAFP